MTMTFDGVPVASASHPEAQPGLLHGNWSIRVEPGEAGYVTSDGEFHPI